MKVRVRLIVETDDGAPPITDEVACLERETLRSEEVGLTLAEAKDVLQRVQQVMVAAQVSEQLEKETNCPDCGQPSQHKGAHTVVVLTLVGTLRVRSPRLYHRRLGR